MTESVPAQPANPATARSNSYVWAATAGGVLIALGSLVPWMSVAAAPSKTGR